MIYQTIDNASQLRDVFFKMGRGNQFSYEATSHLYDYLESLDSDIELDVIALCCDFAEDKLETVLKEYNLETFEELQNNTWAVMVDDETVLYQSF